VENEDIVERIKQIRRDTGLSMEKFSKALGIASSGNISAWESGKSLPGALALRAIHDTFGYSIDWILTGIPVKTDTDTNLTSKPLRNELLRLFDTLTPEAQAILLGTVKTILQHSVITPKPNKINKPKNRPK
jgi:transcriptional regulator with XRE-family HTH domain